ncbi:hypothetical protein V6N13_025808 [Hibiscus sabdariffa]
MLLGLWGGIGCAPLLVSRQFGSQQFVPYTVGLRDSEFAFDTDFRKHVTKINKNWKHCYWIKVVGGKEGLVTPEYESWARTRVNDTLPLPNQGQDTSMEDHLRVFQSEADLLRVELTDAQAEIEKMGAKHTRDLFLKKVEVDEYEGKAIRAMEEYSKLKIDFDLQKEELRKLEVGSLCQTHGTSQDPYRMEARNSTEEEKRKGKEIIKQYQHVLEAEKDNTAAWKRKPHDCKIRLIESQGAYDALETQINQSHAQYDQLEARVRE